MFLLKEYKKEQNITQLKNKTYSNKYILYLYVLARIK